MISEIFNDECDAKVDMTLNDIFIKVKVIHYGAIDFSYTTSYRLASIVILL